jgi:hypothetical protein
VVSPNFAAIHLLGWSAEHAKVAFGAQHALYFVYLVAAPPKARRSAYAIARFLTHCTYFSVAHSLDRAPVYTQSAW